MLIVSQLVLFMLESTKKRKIVTHHTTCTKIRGKKSSFITPVCVQTKRDKTGSSNTAFDSYNTKREQFNAMHAECFKRKYL